MPTPSLFNDDPDFARVSGSLVPRSVPLGDSRKARAVRRLLAQVESLQKEFEREKRRLDDALIFCAAQIRPRRERVTRLRTDVVLAMAALLDDRRIGKADRRVLRALLVEQLDEVLANTEAPAPEIKQLFERLHGVGFDEAVQDEIDEARSLMADAFEELGLDMEVPDLRPGMTEEEMAAAAAQIADHFRQLEEKARGGTPSRRKTKRQLREEKRAEQLEQMRKLSIGAIYKRLVKALHPDLEHDDAARDRKGVLMQEVTAAYARTDLHTLLRLELEWLEGDGDAARRSEQTLDAYAQVLRQQVSQLRIECAELPFHPRYESLVTGSSAFGPHLVDGPAEADRLDTAIAGLSAGLERLTDERQALREVREVIRDYRRSRRR
jgi:hypothetical protein